MLRASQKAGLLWPALDKAFSNCQVRTRNRTGTRQVASSGLRVRAHAARAGNVQICTNNRQL